MPSQLPSRTIVKTPFEIDQDIITNSQSFRRLQDKTQVHPLSENDHVRRRLTHTLEVAAIGRALGLRLNSLLSKADQNIIGVDSSPPLGDILQAACLAHDIGNPPFGHLGEEALRSGFRKVLACVVEASIPCPSPT
jgi:dGTPase